MEELILNDHRIWVCEECHRVFIKGEICPDNKWGHLCKMKAYKNEHRCESYLESFLPEVLVIYGQWQKPEGVTLPSLNTVNE